MPDELPPLPEPSLPTHAKGPHYTADQMRSYAAAAVARERERCAKVCENLAADASYRSEITLIAVAAAIRHG